jgi:hypothetical protein
MRSVLQDWVMALPLREQGALVVGTRGCDVAPKHPMDSTERQLTAFLRYCVYVPADVREVDYTEGAFMQSTPPLHWRQSDIGHYPLHWYSHLMHAYEIVGYRHPSYWDNDEVSRTNIAVAAQYIYRTLVRGLHLMPESRDSMILRLSEDRIANDTVVS